MAEKITYHFLPEDKCLTERQLFDYIDQKLSAADMHLVEKHLLACEMCSDALEGFEKIKHREKVAALIPGAIPDKKEKNNPETIPVKVIPLHPNRKYFAIAAGLILIVGVTLFFKMNMSGDMENAKTADLSGKDSNTTSLIIAPKEATTQKADSLSVTTADTKEKNSARAINSADQQGPTYWNRFGFADSVKQQRESAPENVAAEEQEIIQNDAAPVQSLERPVLDESKDLKQVEDKDLAKSETKKSETQTGADDESVTDAKTKSPDNKSDNYRNENNKDKVVSEKANDKSAAHGSAAPTAQAPSSGTLNAPVNAGASASGNIVTTDSETTLSTNSDSVVADTPRLYPLPLVASDNDLNLAYQNGVKMLDSGQATASIVFFDEVLKKPTHQYYQDAQWKKALALIQLNKKTEAKTLLQEIVKKGGRYKSQAEAKLKEL